MSFCLCTYEKLSSISWSFISLTYLPFLSFLGPTFLTFLFFWQGIDVGPDGLKLISDIIREKMGIDVSVLMGANIANEVAAEKFCETTIGKMEVHVSIGKMKWYNIN